ncbi:rhomboid family intramembrane serine protease [Limnobacter sp.]|uniref:rhomboid family intramembrane serine protease n=1 Tax=Limnobacter sp. TaxID=2003368 RepID=UPI002589CC72|nr:rhomboid family intramembrane serine protease [Limnobacter sp.]
MRNYTPDKPDFRLYLPSIAIAVAAFATQLYFPLFYRQHTDLFDSFFIYLLLAQFVHLSWTHLALNLAGMALLNWGFERVLHPWQWLLTQLASLFAVALYLEFVEPIQWYCGLSGALHFQFAVCLALAWCQPNRPQNTSLPLTLLSVGLVAKLAVEWAQGPHVDAHIGGAIATQAHRGGIVFGLAYAALLLAFRRAASNRAKPASP